MTHSPAAREFACVCVGGGGGGGGGGGIFKGLCSLAVKSMQL